MRLKSLETVENKDFHNKTYHSWFKNPQFTQGKITLEGN